MPRVSGLPCLEGAGSSSGPEAFVWGSSDDMNPPSPITLITREIAISLYTNVRIKKIHPCFVGVITFFRTRFPAKACRGEKKSESFPLNASQPYPSELVTIGLLFALKRG